MYDQHELWKFCIGSLIHHFYKVTINLVSEKILKILANRDEMRKSYSGPSIDASCKMLLYLVKWFQRRRIFEIDKSETRIAYGGHVC